MSRSVQPGDFLMLVSHDKNYETGFYNIVDTSGPTKLYNRVTFETGNGNMTAVKTRDGYKVQGINIPHSVQFVVNLPGINPMNVKRGQRVIMNGLALYLLGIQDNQQKGLITFISNDKTEIHVEFERDGDTQRVVLKCGSIVRGISDWIISAQRGNKVLRNSILLIEDKT